MTKDERKKLNSLVEDCAHENCRSAYLEDVEELFQFVEELEYRAYERAFLDLSENLGKFTLIGKGRDE